MPDFFLAEGFKVYLYYHNVIKLYNLKNNFSDKLFHCGIVF